MKDNIDVLVVPRGIKAPKEMFRAQTRLLQVLSPHKPIAAKNLQSLLDSEGLLIVALRNASVQSNDDWQSLPENHYIGTLTLIFTHTTTRSVAYIDHVVVSPEFQGQGIGKLLLEKAIEEGRVRGVSRFDLTSNESKEVAQKLYEKMGFKKRDTVNWRLEFDQN